MKYMLKPKIDKSAEVVTKETRFESAQAWLSFGIDLESRRIQLDMDVTDVMSSLVFRALLKMADISNEPIEIYLSSYGGEAYSGLAIYDAIRSSPCDIIIYANGKIMSAGVLIFLAGDVRYASKHTTFMMHSVSSGTEGKVKDQEIDVMESKRINNIMLDILAERTKMKRNWWYRKILSHDQYFDATYAKEIGMVDTTPSKKPKIKKKLTNVVKPSKIKKSTKVAKNVRKSKKRR